MPDPGQWLTAEDPSPQAASAQPADVPAQPAEPDTYATGLPHTITLPSGAVVNFKDPDNLKGKDQKAVLVGIKEGQGRTATGLDAIDGLACMLIESWTVRAPLPRIDPSQLGELPFRDYRAVQAVMTPISALLFGDSNSIEDAEKPGSPTRPASA
jgi:hypothetical protein